jgi:hypothetical protein
MDFILKVIINHRDLQYDTRDNYTEWVYCKKMIMNDLSICKIVTRLINIIFFW